MLLLAGFKKLRIIRLSLITKNKKRGGDGK